MHSSERYCWFSGVMFQIDTAHTHTHTHYASHIYNVSQCAFSLRLFDENVKRRMQTPMILISISAVPPFHCMMYVRAHFRSFNSINLWAIRLCVACVYSHWKNIRLNRLKLFCLKIFLFFLLFYYTYFVLFRTLHSSKVVAH